MPNSGNDFGKTRQRKYRSSFRKGIRIEPGNWISRQLSKIMKVFPVRTRWVSRQHSADHLFCLISPPLRAFLFVLFISELEKNWRIDGRTKSKLLFLYFEYLHFIFSYEKKKKDFSCNCLNVSWLARRCPLSLSLWDKCNQIPQKTMLNLRWEIVCEKCLSSQILIRTKVGPIFRLC